MRADPLPPLASTAAAAGSCRFALADLTAETDVAEAGAFDAAVDKGTLDCLDCLGLAPAAVREVHRLLKAGGLLVSVSCRCAGVSVSLRCRRVTASRPFSTLRSADTILRLACDAQSQQGKRSGGALRAVAQAGRVGGGGRAVPEPQHSRLSEAVTR